MDKVLDEVRDNYNKSYRFILDLVEKDMFSYSWPKESCLHIISDVIRAQMRMRNEYIDECKKMSIKSSIEDTD